MGKKESSFISVFVFFVVVILCLAFGEKIVISFYGGAGVLNNSKSMKVHKVPVGGVSFCVPEAYFVYANSLGQNSSIGLNLSMDLEYLKPWVVYDDEVGFSKSRNSLSRDEIKKVKAEKLGLKIDHVKDGLRSIDNRWKILLGVTGVQKEDVGKYTRIMPLKASLFKYYLVPQGAVDYSYIIGCNSGARCLAEAYYGNGIRYEVSFDETRLSYIGDVESRVRGLIDKFICE